MARSLKSETLFRDDDDRKAFLEILGKCLKRTSYRCYAWVLMNNHYHLVVRSSDRQLWEVMKPLNTGYARYHKEMYGRDGPLFRDRFKSIVTQEQNYIRELVRYVHLNPIRAGICADLKSLEKYPWSGHRVLMGKARSDFQDTSTVLRHFGATDYEARQAYRSFMEEGLNQEESEDRLLELVRNSNISKEAGRKARCWVIGDRDFVAKVVSQAEKRRLRMSRFEREGCGLDIIAGKVARKFGVDKKLIRERCRGGKGSEARRVFAYVAVREYGAPSRMTADYCGVGLAALSFLIKAGHDLVNQQKMDILLF